MSDPLRVLLVDDESVDRENIRRALLRSDVNARIVEAASVASGLAKLTEETFDCALVDYRLPDGDAWDFLDARDIKDQVSGESYREPPIVILTGYGSEVVAVEFLKAGACDYVPKSEVTPSRLGQSVRNALRFAQMNRRTREALGNLRDTETCCQYLFEMSSEALIITDLEGTVLKVNPSGCRLFRKSGDDLVGKDILQLVPSERIQEVLGFLPRREEAGIGPYDGGGAAPERLPSSVGLSLKRVTCAGEPALFLHFRQRP